VTKTLPRPLRHSLESRLAPHADRSFTSGMAHGRAGSLSSQSRARNGSGATAAASPPGRQNSGRKPRQGPTRRQRGAGDGTRRTASPVLRFASVHASPASRVSPPNRMRRAAVISRNRLSGASTADQGRRKRSHPVGDGVQQRPHRLLSSAGTIVRGCTMARALARGWPYRQSRVWPPLPPAHGHGRALPDFLR